MRRTLILVLAGLLGACSPKSGPAHLDGTLESVQIGSTPNVHVIDGLYLAGQPSAEDLVLAHEQGIKSVLNLRKDAEVQFDERAAAEAAGLTYVQLPWNGPEELNDDVFSDGRKQLDALERPVLFHCGSANRVGALWIPWRVLDGGVSIDEAVAEAKTIGLKTPEYEAKARDYVERHQR